MTVPEYMVRARTEMRDEFVRLRNRATCDDSSEYLYDMRAIVVKTLPEAREFRTHDKPWGCSFDYKGRRLRAIATANSFQIKQTMRGRD